MGDFIISKINSISLKIVPIIIILFCSFSIYSSINGKFLYDDLMDYTSPTWYRNFSKNILYYNMISSIIILIVTFIYLISVW
jgi:hypothetical protein